MEYPCGVIDPDLRRQPRPTRHVGLLIELNGAALESSERDRIISGEALDQTNVGEVALQSA